MISKILLQTTCLISILSSDICRKYCRNRRICSQRYFDCVYYYRNQRVVKTIEYFSSIKEDNYDALCGQQFFKPHVLPYAMNPRIVGGVDAVQAEFPWIVSLQKQSGKKFVHFCGGAVISDYYILTAAHCSDLFIGEEAKLRIRLGTTNLNSDDGVYMRVSEIIVHEEWDQDTSINDIALYKTKRPIRYTIDKESGRYFINSVCLPLKQDDIEPEYALVAGWGQMEVTTDIKVSPQLQKALVPKYPYDICRINYRDLGAINTNMFCYGGEGDIDSCLGDSGGPLIAQKGDQYVVIGVVSYGVPCAINNYPTIYTKTIKYLDWIHEKIRI